MRISGRLMQVREKRYDDKSRLSVESVQDEASALMVGNES